MENSYHKKMFGSTPTKQKKFENSRTDLEREKI